MGVALYCKWEYFVCRFLGIRVSREVPLWIQSVFLDDGKLIFVIKSRFLECVVNYLKKRSDLQFCELLDISGVDYPSRNKRFEAVYLLVSFLLNLRLELRVCLQEFSGLLSLTKIYSSAGWLERELWDMYGVFFSGHSDLRRILTDYGFEGFPLRKDFPLTGFTEVRYDDERAGIVYEPLEVAQEFRYFDFASPWEFRS